jgi:hypothetical protein
MYIYVDAELAYVDEADSVAKLHCKGVGNVLFVPFPHTN